MKFSLEQLKNITGAKLVQNRDAKVTAFSISTDTRTIKAGDVYLPLSGESFDGEAFIPAAIEKGAAGFFTAKQAELPNNNTFSLLVPDTKIAYLQLANFYKNQVNPVTIAITGSSGKTTTKEIFGAVFGANRRTHRSKLNHNNEIGLCQTLLTMPEGTEVLIIEMGMRGQGEIELLTKYAQPDFAVITNIGTAHIGRLGSRENIAKAKCEIVKGLKSGGTLITLPDDLYKFALAQQCFEGKHNIVTPKKPDFEIVLMEKDRSVFNYKGFEYTLYAGGEYAVHDALLAIETALLYGLTPQEIQTGLKNYTQIEKRFEECDAGGLKIINDSYNANPESMKAAIKTFLDLYGGEKALVLADMGELGDEAPKYHREIGEFLNGFENVNLITIGELSKNISDALNHANNHAQHFCDKIEAAQAIKKLKKGTAVLLKGSRSMKLEELIEEIKK